MRRSKETRKEYIYLLQEREFVRSNEQTYKIGRTKGLNKRLSAYPKDSELHFLCDVDDSISVERTLKNYFKETFVQQRQYGCEYFSGDVNRMKSLISQTLFPTITKSIKIAKPLPRLPSRFQHLKGPPQKLLPHLPLVEKAAPKTFQREYVWKCKICDKRLKSRYSLESHAKVKIPCDLKCRLCGSQFQNTRQYTRHIRKH